MVLLVLAVLVVLALFYRLDKYTISEVVHNVSLFNGSYLDNYDQFISTTINQDPLISTNINHDQPGYTKINKN